MGRHVIGTTDRIITSRSRLLIDSQHTNTMKKKKKKLLENLWDMSLLTPTERLMLGLAATTTGFRQDDIIEFLRGVIRRKEPSYTLAAQGIRNGAARAQDVVSMFTFVPPATMNARVREMMMSDNDPARAAEILEHLAASVHEEETRTLHLIRSLTDLRGTLEKRKVKSKMLSTCLKELEPEVRFEADWLHVYTQPKNSTREKKRT